MSNINGKLMSKDTVVATVKDGIVTIVNERLVPFYFRRSEHIEGWLKDRAIDDHRTNSRLLKKALRLENKDDVSTVLSVNAVTITDNYWFCPENESLTWEDVRFKENYFAHLALKGSLSAFNLEPSKTPELTNRGSFEKCWLQENDNWWLYKTGSNNAFFSELFIYKLGEKLGFDMAHYELADGYIRTLDFTNNGKYNLEPMKSLIGDNEDYSDNFNLLYSLSPALAEQYLQIIYLDTVCLSVDRHTENYGILRDPINGDILRMAPNYDNNIALIYDGYENSPSREKDGFINHYFVKFMKENNVAAEMFCKMNIPRISENMISECLDEIPIKVNEDYIKKFILNGQHEIEKKLSFLCLDNKLFDATKRCAISNKNAPSVSKEKNGEIDKE